MLSHGIVFAPHRLDFTSSNRGALSELRQPRDEWVALLQGEAELRFESGESSLLHAGDSLVIPAHRRHRVERTSNDAVWLALHF